MEIIQSNFSQHDLTGLHIKLVPTVVKYQIAPLLQVYKNIFQNDWICAGHISEFSQSGSFKVINNSNESALITKDNDGSINAFYNLCRHRGTRIKDEPCGKFKNNIRCNYHGWSYDLKGELISAPHMNKVEGLSLIHI